MTIREDGNNYFEVRFGADARINDRANCNIAASDRCLLKSPERRQLIDSAITSVRYRVNVVSCDDHCGGGGM